MTSASLLDRLPEEERARLRAARDLLAKVDPACFAEMCDEDGVTTWVLASGTRGRAIARFANEWGVDFTEVRLSTTWMAWDPWPPFADLLEERLDDALGDVLYPTGLAPGEPFREATDEQIAEAWSLPLPHGPKRLLDAVIEGQQLGYWDETGRGCPWVAVKRGTPGAHKWWRADSYRLNVRRADG